MKPSKKTLEWNKARAGLKKKCEAKGITSCQLRYAGCLGGSFLSFAHPKKRRNLLEGEIHVSILTCQNCHNILERKPKDEMEQIVMDKYKEIEC